MWQNVAKILLVLSAFCSASKLDAVNDNTLIEMIRENKNLVVLFSKKNCDECDLLETALTKLKEHFEQELKATTIKAMNSQLVRLYSSIKKDPAIVFFRHGVPLLYDGEPNEHEIFDYLNDNKDPLVKELSDENFEHLTQASSGATTGDWLIMFYSPECVDCQRMTAIWEAVASKLKARLNVARINRGRGGILTGKRFKIEKSPEFLLLRQGKFYRYELKNYEINSFVSFAQSWYKNVAAEKVPTPATPFENLVDTIVKKLKELPSLNTLGPQLVSDHPLIVIAAASVIFFVFVFILFSKFKKPTHKKTETTTKKAADGSTDKKKQK